MKKFLLLAISVVQSLIFFAQVPGSLDAGFGGTGIVTVGLPALLPGPRSPIAGANSIAIQSDGKVVAGGFYQPNNVDVFTLVRLNADGTLDNSFGGDGVVITDVDPLPFRADAIFSIAIQSDGMIVAGGYSLGPLGFRFALARYEVDGDLDPLFGSGGVVTTQVGTAGAIPYSIAIQPDGKIVAAGFSNDGTTNNVAVVRYNTDGTLDNTFNPGPTGGIVSTPIGASDDTAYSVRILPLGQILIAGSTRNGTSTDFALARYNSDGGMDGSFDSDGIVTTDFDAESDVAYSIAVDALGRYVVGGTSVSSDNATDLDLDFALARYNSDGSLDITGFGSGGKVTTDVGAISPNALNDFARSVAIQDNGRIIAAGTSQASALNSNFALVRYNSDGTLDNTFGPGTNGIVTTDVTGGNELGLSMRLTGMRIYLAGISLTDQGFLFAAYINDAFALPLKLRKLTGTRKNNGVILQWQTDFEQNTSLFIVQRSSEGRSFVDIGSIPAAGNSSNLLNYEFTDASPLRGENYYRLRQIDQAGRVTYSPVIKMVTDVSDMVFSLSPNPANSFLNVIYPGKLDKVNVRIYDNQGKLILQQTRKNEIPVRVDLKQLKAGLYFIQLSDGETVRQSKFFKQ